MIFPIPFTGIPFGLFQGLVRPDLSFLGPSSETGRMRFRRVRFQTRNSVSFFALTELRGEISVSSSQPLFCAPKRTRRVFLQNSPSLQLNSVSSVFRKSTLEIVFRRFLFPDFSGFPDFELFLGLLEHLQGTFPKGSATQSGPSRKKWDIRRFGNP